MSGRNRFTYMVLWLAALVVVIFGPRLTLAQGIAIGALISTSFILGAYFGSDDGLRD